MSSASPMLAVKGLKKSFGDVTVVKDVAFDMRPGETVALLGPSGCGKTSTLRIIAGFSAPDAGAVEIRGQDVTGKRPYERNIGILFQDYALFPHMTVAENVGFGPLHRGLSKAETAQRVDRYLALVHMTAMRDRYPTSLSGGQQQRVALARALATEPEILLLDEPLSALDAKMREGLRAELKQILAETGVTTIIVTHDQEEALSLADRVLVMHRGMILQDAAPREIYDRPANRFVAEFVGRSNWLRGQVIDNGEGARFVTADGIGFAAPAQLPRQGEFLCFIRPENVSLLLDQEVVPAGHIVLPGLVEDVTFLGQDTEVAAKVGGTRIAALARQRDLSKLKSGDPIRLCFAADRVGHVDVE